MEWMREGLSVVGYTNHVMSPEVLEQKSKIQADRFHQTFRVAGTLKSSQKDNPKIPDIITALVGPLNSTLYTGRTVYCYSLFHVLINKLFELNEVLIHLFVAVSLRINAILTQYAYENAC